MAKKKNSDNMVLSAIEHMHKDIKKDINRFEQRLCEVEDKSEKNEDDIKAAKNTLKGMKYVGTIGGMLLGLYFSIKRVLGLGG